MASFQYRLFSKVIRYIPLNIRLQILYFRRFHHFFDKSKPICFSEKLQIRKIKDRRKLLVVAADKLESKKYVKRKVPEIYIPKTLWEGNSLADVKLIEFNSLPSNYVFKANHTSQTIEFIRDAKHLSMPRMLELASKWFNHDQSGSLGEWAYQDIPKKVFIEEFLDFSGNAPDDYKFFVYHGKVKYIQLDSDRFNQHRRNMFDVAWNDLGFEFSHPRKLPSPPRPEILDKMIQFAEKIGEDFDFIRVDFYIYKGFVTFGELTVYPGAGFEKFPIRYWDVEFGKYWEQSYD